MAYIGLEHLVAAPITNDATVEIPQYGSGFNIADLIAAEITTEYNNNPLWADNMQVESDRSFKSGKITLEQSDFDMQVKAKLCGGEYIPESTADSNKPKAYKSNVNDEPPEVGIGYCKTRKKHGKATYIAKWISRSRFTPPSESGKTKGESIEWETEKIEGEIYPCIDGAWKEEAEFEKKADAIQWLNAKANINPDGGETA